MMFITRKNHFCQHFIAKVIYSDFEVLHLNLIFQEKRYQCTYFKEEK